MQITVSEDIGVGSRGGYFEEVGTLRDMMQNHLLQIMSLVAMEPPPSLEAEDIRNEKVIVQEWANQGLLKWEVISDLKDEFLELT